jgi:hypothetical protein
VGDARNCRHQRRRIIWIGITNLPLTLVRIAFSPAEEIHGFFILRAIYNGDVFRLIIVSALLDFLPRILPGNGRTSAYWDLNPQFQRSIP